MLMPHDPRQNRLLAALPADECECLFPHLELVPMPFSHVIYEPGVPIRHVYFPTTAIVSLSYILGNGASSEIAVVGNEGIVGVSLFMGGETMASRAVVQNTGHAYRLHERILKAEFDRAGGRRSGTFQNLLLRYTQALMTQAAQTAVCNRHHTLDQQLCRRLLLSLDRLPSNALNITQELIANLLGVRREGVTEAAGNLQKAGLIEYRRGHLTVLNRSGLEARACECYAVVNNEYQRLLAQGSATKIGARLPARAIAEKGILNWPDHYLLTTQPPPLGEHPAPPLAGTIRKDDYPPAHL